MSARAVIIENPNGLEKNVLRQAEYAVMLHERIELWKENVDSLLEMINDQFARLIEAEVVKSIIEDGYYYVPGERYEVKTLRLQLPIDSFLVVEQHEFYPINKMRLGTMVVRFNRTTVSSFSLVKRGLTEGWDWYYYTENSEYVELVTPSVIANIFEDYVQHIIYHNPQFRYWQEDQEKAKP